VLEKWAVIVSQWLGGRWPILLLRANAMVTQTHVGLVTIQHRKLINIVRLYMIANHYRCLIITRNDLRSLLGISRFEGKHKQLLMENLRDEGLPYVEEWSRRDCVELMSDLAARRIWNVSNRNQFEALIVSTVPLDRDTTPEDYEHGQDWRIGILDLHNTMLAPRIANYSKVGLNPLDELNREHAAGKIPLEEFVSSQ
jgi:hypothetical protein